MESRPQRTDEQGCEGGAAAESEPITAEHPEAALAVLEADQLVAAKQRTRFGRRKLSLSTKVLLWGLRIYVVIMLILVLITVVRSLHGGH